MGIGVKVFTQASISRIQRGFYPSFHYSHTAHRAWPDRRNWQKLTWALAVFLDTLPSHLTWGHSS